MNTPNLLKLSTILILFINWHDKSLDLLPLILFHFIKLAVLILTIVAYLRFISKQPMQTIHISQIFATIQIFFAFICYFLNKSKHFTLLLLLRKTYLKNCSIVFINHRKKFDNFTNLT